jgi:MFS family permease
MAIVRSSDERIERSWFESGRKNYVLLLLALVYTFNYVDRQILIILAEPIRSEFGLKDWQLGFLTGTAFALFYATLGIPIARLADRGNRVNIIVAALTIWSAMTALCGAASGFVQLALARVGVGVGEAGGSPPAVSLLSSYFSPQHRSTAMAVYSVGATVGILLGFVIGGLVNQHYGWRAAFLIAGVPGLLLAVLLKSTVIDPGRTPMGDLGAPDSVPPFIQTLTILWSIKTFRLINFAAVAAAIAVYGFMVWVPIYIIRQFGLTTGEVGTAIGLIAGIAGSTGVFLGGFLADLFSKIDQRWQLRIPALTTLMFPPLILLVINASTAKAAMVLLVPAYALALAYTGPTWAVLATSAPAHMRSMAAAILLFLVNLIGLGMGPQLIGIISDIMPASMGASALRFSIAMVCSVSAVASLFYYLASKGLRTDNQSAASF